MVRNRLSCHRRKEFGYSADDEAGVVSLSTATGTMSLHNPFSRKIIPPMVKASLESNERGWLLMGAHQSALASIYASRRAWVRECCGFTTIPPITSLFYNGPQIGTVDNNPTPNPPATLQPYANRTANKPIHSDSQTPTPSAKALQGHSNIFVRGEVDIVADVCDGTVSDRERSLRWLLGIRWCHNQSSRINRAPDGLLLVLPTSTPTLHVITATDTPPAYTYSYPTVKTQLVVPRLNAVTNRALC